MKIIIVSGSLNRGGAERVISILSGELVKRGWDVTILTILSNKCGYQLNPKIKVRDLSRKGSFFLVPRLAKAVRKVIIEQKPDAVVSFMIAVNIVTWLATRGLDIKFIPSERNDPSIGRRLTFKIMQNIVYRTSTKTVFQTERAKKFFSEKIQKNSVIIHNPVTVKTYAQDKRDTKIVSIGRLEPQKNQKLLIDAFAEIHKKHPDYKLDIYGEGSLKDALTEQIKELGLHEVVQLRGNHNNVHEQISNAAFFVLTSNFEGQSNALLEAMMMGIPCISTNCCGAEDVIVNGISGLLIHIGEKDELVEAMEKMITNQKEANIMGTKGMQIICKEYNTESIVDQWESLLKH